MCRRVWTRRTTQGPYRMQVTEAVCWSFMLFLRSRMLSEDWYTCTLRIRGVRTCDRCSPTPAPEVRPPPLPPPPSPRCQVSAQGTEIPKPPCGLQTPWQPWLAVLLRSDPKPSCFCFRIPYDFPSRELGVPCPQPLSCPPTSHPQCPATQSSGRPRGQRSAGPQGCPG